MKCLTDKEVRLQRLKDAAIAVHQAVDSRGLHIRLCHNPMNINAVRQSLGMVGGWFRDPGYTIWLGNDGKPDATGELNAVTNLRLLATLLEAHLAAIQ